MKLIPKLTKFLDWKKCIASSCHFNRTSLGGPKVDGKYRSKGQPQNG